MCLGLTPPQPHPTNFVEHVIFVARKVRLHKHSMVFCTCLKTFWGWLNLVFNDYSWFIMIRSSFQTNGKWMLCQESNVRALDASSWNACNASHGSNGPRSLDSASSPPRWSSSNRSRCQYSNGETSKCVLVADVWVKHEMNKLNFTRMRVGTKLVLLDSRFVKLCLSFAFNSHCFIIFMRLYMVSVCFKSFSKHLDSTLILFGFVVSLHASSPEVLSMDWNWVAG